MRSLRLLGAVEIEEAGQRRPFGARKYLVLLALLALNPKRTFARSELVASLWPESDETAGRAALRTALSALRQEFGTDIFVTTTQTVRLAEGAFTTDVALLEEALQKARQVTQAEEARLLQQEIAQWNRGTLLAGRYEDWIVEERERLNAAIQAAMARCEMLRQVEQRSSSRPKNEGPTLLKLPQFNSRFLGRETEIQSAVDILMSPGVRLVTLTGVGGIGKTRLSTEIARHLLPQFPGAVCFIPLETVTDGNDILPLVVHSLRIDGQAASDQETVLARSLREWGPSLLILDNLEQMVASGAARAVRALLALSPDLRLLVTSRQLIGCEGEHAFPVRGLSPHANQRLFVEQAQAVRPEFTVTEQNRTVVEELCAKLDGIPLAIELCAAWAALLTPQQMSARMEDRFALLKSRRQDIVERHRSLHATLEWGCPTEPELLAFFLALSVFRGGFTLEAAEEIAGKGALELLASLQERSLIVAEPQEDGTMRYRLLETIREFAEEKMTEEVCREVQERHLLYFERLAWTLSGRLSGSDAAIYFAALDRENPNFRATIEFGLSDAPANLEKARTTISALEWYWSIRGHQVPWERWADVLFARYKDLPPQSQPWQLIQQATRLSQEEAEPLLQQAMSQFEELGDIGGIARVLLLFAHISFERHDLPKMESYARRAAELRENAGDIRGAGYMLANLAGNYAKLGMAAEARALWSRCREIAIQFEDVGGIAVLDRAEAHMLFAEGKVAEAIILYEKALFTFRHKGENWHIMDTLHRYGEALLQLDRREEARHYLTEAAHLAEAGGDRGRASLLREVVQNIDT